MPFIQLRFRRGLKAEWDSQALTVNLAAGELAIESDTNQFKIGDNCRKHMYDTDWTDDEGRVIVEPLKE